jgi:hypothetical protein
MSTGARMHVFSLKDFHRAVNAEMQPIKKMKAID